MKRTPRDTANQPDLHHKRTTNSKSAPQMVHNYSSSIVGRYDAIRKDGTLPIQLLVVINRRTVPITLGVSCSPDEFDSEKGRITYSKKNDPTGELTSDANMDIIQAQLKANQIFVKHRYLNIALDKTTFLKEYRGSFTSGNFYEFIENSVIDEFAKTNTKSTIVIYKTTLSWLKKYKPTCLLSDLSPFFVNEFDRFLKKSGLSQNSRMKYMKTLKFFCNHARLKNLLFSDVFKEFTIKRIEGSREHLDIEEMKNLIDLYYKETLPNHLQITLRKFIFSMFTGIRISDLNELSDFNLIGNSLVFKPKKTAFTGNIIKVPLSKIASQFINSEVEGKVFEKQSDQLVNKNLKIIALVAEIPKLLTSHVARHTFATNFVELDGNLPALQLILGHAKIETTMVYVKVSKKRQEDGVRKFDQAFSEYIKKGPTK